MKGQRGAGQQWEIRSVTSKARDAPARLLHAYRFLLMPAGSALDQENQEDSHASRHLRAGVDAPPGARPDH
jgi:hypothetical protein